MKKVAILGSVILIFLVVIGVTWYRIELLKPAAVQSASTAVEIVQGASSQAIARQLKDQGLIRSPLAFLTYVKSKNLVLQSGFYTLDPSNTSPAIAETIGRGKVSEYQVTIPEGWRLEQIAQLLHNRKIVEYPEFVAAAAGKQGRLFPDTYRFGANAIATDMVATMEKNFERRLKEAGIAKLSSDQVILASIIEREAKRDEDRPKMAGVYLNRLKINMALEADPTVQYAIDTERISKLSIGELASYEFWQPPTLEQNKSIESTYNTYRHRGSPPAPIANPGIKSLQAAVKPGQHSFYFFFNLPDGTTIYSKTREEHNANLTKHRS